MTNEVLIATDLVTLYEVRGPDGLALWGGTDTNDLMYWFRRKAPAGSTVTVQTYDEDDQEAWPNGEPIDITAALIAAIASVSGD